MKHTKIIGALIVIVCAALIGAYIVVFEVVYKDRVYPGVTIGEFSFGGLYFDEAREALGALVAQFDEAGLHFVFQDKEGMVKEMQLLPTIFTSGVGDSQELVHINIEETGDSVFAFGRSGSHLVRAYERMRALLFRRALGAAVAIDRARLHELMSANLAPYVRSPKDARLVVVPTPTSTRSYVLPSEEGSVLAMDRAVDTVVENTERLVFVPIFIERRRALPAVTYEEAVPLTNEVQKLLSAPVVIAVTSTATSTEVVSAAQAPTEWRVQPKEFASWLEFQKNDSGSVVIGFSKSALKAFFDREIRPHVEVAMQDARFKLEGTRVVEFVGSREGVRIDDGATFAALNALLQKRIRGEAEEPVVLTFTREIPTVKTAEVNNLGITEIVGVGTSMYKGSPANRIKNIRHAVKKLNGILIAPGETFSLLGALRPFTVEGGYLPELVIKGDRIIPEIAGGLCQIGTTMFRSAMNAGTDIVERRNHSIVVRYYNDLKNGNPGTDATIYEPSPDFKFKNDYPHHLLLITEMDEKKAELRFYLWGTRDGRQGSYSAPVVTRWRPAGEERVVKTADLPAGKKECQEAHPGADASFVYTVVRRDGTIAEREFVSHYRSIPRICMVGATPEELLAEGGGTVAPEGGEATEEAIIE